MAKVKPKIKPVAKADHYPLVTGKTYEQFVQAERLEWLRARKKGIGSSDAAAIMGRSNHGSPFSVWADKTTPKVEEEDPIEGSDAIYFGHANEESIAFRYAQLTGHRVTDPGPFAIQQHPEHKFATSTIDRWVETPNDPEPGILECKNHDRTRAHEWARNSAPEECVIQVQHQMAVTGAKFAICAVCLGGNKLDWSRIERDDEFIKELIACEAEMWSWVLTNTQPSIDGSEATTRAMKRLYPNDNGVTIPLPFDAARRDEELLNLKARAKEIEEQIEEHKNWFRNQIVESTVGTFAGGRYSNTTTIRKDTLHIDLDTESQLSEDGIPFERKEGAVFRTLRRLK